MNAERAAASDLFGAIDRYLKDNRRRFDELFSSFDVNKNGLLDKQELTRLVKDMLGMRTLAPGDVDYFT